MRTARSRTSGENLFDFFMAQSSQRFEPPQNTGRFIPVSFAVLISIIYFRADAPGQAIRHRLLASAHGISIAALYLAAWLVYLTHHASDSLAGPYTFLMLVPLGLMALSPFVFRGRWMVHLLLLPLALCLFWVWLRGAVVVTGFLF